MPSPTILQVREVRFAPGAIKTARRAAGMSQHALGAAVGVQPQQVSRWENGQGLRGHHAYAVLAALGLEPAFALTADDAAA